MQSTEAEREEEPADAAGGADEARHRADPGGEPLREELEHGAVGDAERPEEEEEQDDGSGEWRLAGHAEDQTLAPILVGMFVDEGMRRCGIGEALVEAIKSWARSGGHDTLHLWVVSTNTPALALYRRCGFVASGRSRPVAHTPALTELHMLVDLGPN